jgi:hypothetical protein
MRDVPDPTPEQPAEQAAPNTPDPSAPEGPAHQPVEGAETAPASGAGMPDYKGEPLDSDRGPGLGCFWIQIALLTFFLIFTPLTVTWGWDPRVSAALLIFTLILLLFSGQTIIFLLRLVAADRRTQRTPLDPAAKPTVGQMEAAGTAPPTTAPEETAGERAPAADDTPATDSPPAPEAKNDEPADG